jgi:4-hydroxy-tetrahydrodipicolinate reductase
LELVGAYGKRWERAGTDVGHAIGLERDLGISIEGNLPAAAERTRPDVAIQATCSRLDDAWPEIAVLLRHGISVISIAEEMAYPAYRSPAIAAEMRDLACATGAAVVGTGINPGFLLDLLVITLTGICLTVDSITATRVNDLSPYGPTVLDAQGVGLTPEAFEAGLRDGTVTGHLGFPESISMIAAALGCVVDRIEQAVEPIVSEVKRKTPFVTVEPGCVAGSQHTAVAYRDGEPFIIFDHPQQVRPELAGIETGDSIEIVGTPGLRFTGSPEIPGGKGTVAIAVNGWCAADDCAGWRGASTCLSDWPRAPGWKSTPWSCLQASGRRRCRRTPRAFLWKCAPRDSLPKPPKLGRRPWC